MSAYQQLVVFYFSGTGNARRTAEWIVDEVKQMGVSTHLVNIEKDVFEYSSLDEKTLIGICAPTHGFNLPPIVLSFLVQLPRLKSKAFIVNTRGGTKLGRFFLPGYSGLAQVFPALILLLKGVRTIAFRPVDLPSNWVSLHPGLKQVAVEKIVEHWHTKVRRFAQKVIAGKKEYIGLYTLLIDLPIAPIAVGYYLVGRFALAKTFYATSACTHCGVCVNNCPVNAIEERKSLFWNYRCESCMRCMGNCPERAIETAHGFTIFLWWVIFSIFPVWFLSFLSDQQITDLNNAWLKKAIEILLWGVGLFLVFGMYRVMNYMLRYKWFNYLIVHTSFTRFRFWNRYRFPVKLLKKLKQK